MPSRMDKLKIEFAALLALVLLALGAGIYSLFL
jgi:hypothetical protein